MKKNIFRLRHFIFICLLILNHFSTLAQQSQFSINELLKVVKPEQPRLLYTFEHQEKLEEMMSHDSVSQRELNALIEEAQRLVKLPEVDYNRPFDSASIELYQRVIVLSYASRHTGRKQFFVKIMKELDKAVELPSWGQKGFTSMSMMTISVALGYDWMYTTLNGDTRKRYNEAILNKGIRPGLVEYEKIKPGQKIPEGDWIYTPHPSSIANNSGMLIGALAIARDFPQASASTIYYASSSLSNALRNFPLSIVDKITPSDEVGLFFTVSSLKFALSRDFGISTSLGYKLITQSFQENGKNSLNQGEHFVYKYITELR